MTVGEHTFSFLLRNSGDVLEEVEHRDVILQRRDGEDLYLALRSRERGIRDGLGMLARVLRSALRDDATHVLLASQIADELPWTSFLPKPEREAFLVDLVRTAAASSDVDTFDPFVRTLESWKLTAEVYADPQLLELLESERHGPAVPVKRPAV